MCRDFVQKQSCPRGVHCTFAHSKSEMDKYRAKNRHSNGSILPISSSTTTTNLPPSQPSSVSLPMFATNNASNIIRPIHPPILPLWNPQQQTQHLLQEIPQQHHHQYERNSFLSMIYRDFFFFLAIIIIHHKFHHRFFKCMDIQQIHMNIHHHHRIPIQQIRIIQVKFR